MSQSQVPRLPTDCETVTPPGVVSPAPEITCRRCGSTQYVDVPIHNGQSVRRDCTRCGRFVCFPVWYGAAVNPNNDRAQCSPDSP